MGNSLQDELLKAGLIDTAKVKKAQKQKSKQTFNKRKQKPKVAQQAPSEEQRRAQQVREEKKAQDRALNEQRNEARRQREVAAQINQMVRDNLYPRSKGEDDAPFYFEYKGKAKRLYVAAPTRTMIIDGKLSIINFNGVFELVPAEIGAKVKARNPSIVVDLPEEEKPAEDDPYAAYQVPDDLMW